MKPRDPQKEQALLDAALAVADREGLEALTVQKVARQAGFTPDLPFRQFYRSGPTDAQTSEVSRLYLDPLEDLVRRGQAAGLVRPWEPTLVLRFVPVNQTAGNVKNYWMGIH